MAGRQDVQQRAMVAKLSRTDLEDQHLRLMEDINILKVHGRKQEEKIKKMATKLIRLANDRKKLVALANDDDSGRVHRSAREVDLEEEIERQQDTIRQLNKEKDILKQKLRSAHQQLLAQGKRPTAYQNVASRTDSRINKPADGASTKKFPAGRSTGSPSPRPARYGHSLLEEARSVNENLQQQILTLQRQLARYEEEKMQLQRQLDTANANHEEEILTLRQTVNVKEKSILGDNIDLIRMQRQIKDKSDEIRLVESRYHDLEMNFQKLVSKHEGVLREMERLKLRLNDEERHNISVQNSLKQGSSYKQNVVMLQETVRELENEVSLLKEANEKLTHRAFDQEKERQWRQLERDLRVQIAQLEMAIKADMNDKSDILNKISSERGYSAQLRSQSQKSAGELERMRQENADLRDRLQLYTLSGDSVDVEEVREALAIIRKKRHAAAQNKRPDFLEKVDDKDLGSEFSSLQSEHVETVRELDKTREILLMQHKINKDYQIEVESVTNQMEEMRREYDSKLDRLARLLDARAARIKKLESQLHDVAYGTKQYKVKQEEEFEADHLQVDTIQLERGHNLFEINVFKVVLSNEAIEMLDDHSAALFVTYAFYDFELVSSPILKFPNLLYDSTAQFTVKVDDTFLHYLQKESTVFELHQAMGIEHRTIASCKIRFHELLERPQGKLHGSATLIGINGGNCGSIDFWIRLRVPVDQAIRLYRERVKALGYLSANTAATKKTIESLDAELRQDENEVNQLLVQILSCNHVQARQPDVQPSIYCVYKLFDFGDHDTSIIPNSNNPVFDDRQAYPVHVDAELDAYLRSEKLRVYVFDDTDPDMTSYLGMAAIDLLPLAHNKPIRAPFQLRKSNGDENGTIEFGARWQLEYKPPSGIMRGEELHEEEMREMAVMEKPPTPKKPPHPSRLTSTPKPSRRKAQFSSNYESSDRGGDEKTSTLSHRAAKKKPESDEKPTNDVGTDVKTLLTKSTFLPEVLQEQDPVPPETIEEEEEATDAPSESPVISEEVMEEEVAFNEDVMSEVIEEKSDIDVLPKTEERVTVDVHHYEPIKVKSAPAALPRITSRKKKANEEDVTLDKFGLDPLDEDEESEIEEHIDEHPPGDDDIMELESHQSRDEQSHDHPFDTVEEIRDTADRTRDAVDDAVDEARDTVDDTVDEARDTVDDTVDEARDTVDDAVDEARDTEDDTVDEILDFDDKALDTHEQQSTKPDVRTRKTGSTSSDDKRTEREVDSTTLRTEQPEEGTIEIGINHLILDPHSSVWSDDEVQKLFVEFDFLGSVEETPDAVEKPQKKGEKMIYGFKKSIQVDQREHQQNRDALQSMMTSGHTSFKLTLVSEPPGDDDDEADCEEIGTASVDLATILNNKRDIVNDDIVVEDLRTPGQVVGKINISISALNVLQMIKQELYSRLPEHDT